MGSSSPYTGSLKALRALPTCLWLLSFLSLPDPAGAGQTNEIRSPATIVATYFENADISRNVHYLTEDQNTAAYALTGDKKIRNIVYAYTISMNGDTVGIAYFDRHAVRSLPQTLMIVVTPKNAIERVEVITFTEPLEYRPPSRWYATFKNAVLTPEKTLSPSIHGVTGATLTHRATTRAAKRALALHRVLRENAAE